MSSICKTCLHSRVCGLVLTLDPELSNCADRIAANCTWIEDVPGIYRCPECGHTEGKKRNFCCDCGSKFNMED